MYVFINLLDNLGQYNSYQLPGQLKYFGCVFFITMLPYNIDNDLFYEDWTILLNIFS